MKVEDEQQFKKLCCYLLAQNRAILIYPEMGRNPEGLGEFKTWAAEVALAAKVPVFIPVICMEPLKSKANPAN